MSRRSKSRNQSTSKRQRPKATQKPAKSPSKMPTTRAINVTAENAEWVWRGRFPLNAVSVIAGPPGLGKSQIGAMLAARVSKGAKWPCEEGSAPTGDVFMLTGEDDHATTVKPRLMAANADLEKVHLITESDVNLPDELDNLEIAIEHADNPKLLIIDPVSSFFGTDLHEPVRARALLSRLGHIAKSQHMAIILIGHLTKLGGKSALSSLAGSSAIAAAARAVYLVTSGDPDSRWRIFACVKNNLAPDKTALQFRIRRAKVGKIRTTRVAWHKERLQMTADEALAKAKANSSKPAAVRPVDELLKGLLADGKRAVSDIFEKGRSSGFSEKQLRAAAGRLGVDKTNTGFADNKKWFWEVPLVRRTERSAE
jgi:putative DNA primase/helicase